MPVDIPPMTIFDKIAIAILLNPSLVPALVDEAINALQRVEVQ